jgi:hypothetical protein
MPDQNPTSMSDYAGPNDGPVIDLTRGGVFTPQTGRGRIKEKPKERIYRILHLFLNLILQS